MTGICPVCHSPEWRLKFRKQNFDFVECRSCGLLGLDPIPTVEQLDAHYSARAASGNYTLESVAKYVPVATGIFDFIETQQPAGSTKRIFDIGCLYGHLLDIGKERGWETWGLELQGPAAEYAKQRHDGRVFAETVEEFEGAEAGYFDVVTAIGLIEHARDPSKVLSIAQRLLKPGGTLVIQTPNAASVPAKLMGRYWPPIAAPEHIFYFSPHTLSMISRSHGLTPDTWKAHWKTLPVGYVFDQLAFFGPELSAVIEKVRPAIPAAVQRAKLRFYGGEVLFVARKEAASQPA
jgi:2-polyprenyl-3-methyl-5-hydroxy-6-metoxy-1,4-benzoquinol methylase